VRQIGSLEIKPAPGVSLMVLINGILGGVVLEVPCFFEAHIILLLNYALGEVLIIGPS